MSDTPHPARPAPLATLALQAGPRAGEALPVPAPVVTMGRSAGCEVVVDDDSVSAQHARLEFDTGAWRITDLDSTNGTSVEGVRLAPGVPTPLPYGSTVRLGGVRMHFREAEGADPETARAAYMPPPPPTRLREERTGFRLPVWLLLAIVVIVVAITVILYVNFAGVEATVETVPVEAPAAPAEVEPVTPGAVAPAAPEAVTP